MTTQGETGQSLYEEVWGWRGWCPDWDQLRPELRVIWDRRALHMQGWSALFADEVTGCGGVEICPVRAPRVCDYHGDADELHLEDDAARAHFQASACVDCGREDSAIGMRYHRMDCKNPAADRLQFACEDCEGWFYADRPGIAHRCAVTGSVAEVTA